MQAEAAIKLKEATNRLQQLNQTAYQQFSERTQAADYQTDFYSEVKPFADEMQRVLDVWRPLADAWVKTTKPRYVFPIQIKDTYDNLAIVCVTAFQKDTRKRRFYETIKSIDYVLSNILDQLDQDQTEL
ncbi:YppE family protein [Sporolactobacillus shoreicorticis]|uniref:YppE family protein n=1 Tax=Sporolactobacillus shoreicorticis TaxID=1923877 RepID=A0ABW5S7L5_9BACL|nr:YppE family protein [Sporolactobacillus shoreicorticis]MCO7125764.1 YppE family protein [Sporolactobacillus shoreicorticis]